MNVHQFYVPDTYEDYINIVNKLGRCTIRTDHETITDDLPFYVIDSRQSIEVLDIIWRDAINDQYTLIISDGIKYDPIQKYNMVVQLQENGDFIFEASDLKIPLRHMYRHPLSLLSCTGNLKENINLWHFYNSVYNIDRLIIQRDLLTLYNYGLFSKWLEITKYPIGVGVKKERIVFWQIK